VGEEAGLQIFEQRLWPLCPELKKISNLMKKFCMEKCKILIKTHCKNSAHELLSLSPGYKQYHP
jgi:hypothetical protein